MNHQRTLTNLRLSCLRKPPRRNNQSPWLRRIALHVIYTVLTIVENIQPSRLHRHVYLRPSFDFRKHISSLPDPMFKRMYRISKQQFKILHSLVYPSLRRTQRNYPTTASYVSPAVMLFVTLRFLADASYLDLCWPYALGISTVYKVFQETLITLNRTLPKLHFPCTEEECTISARNYELLRKSPFHGVVGALDGGAFEIRRPTLSEVPDPRKYYNRKGFFALVVQAAVEADYKFSFLSARHSGGTHDSTAFAATHLYNLLKSDQLPDWATVFADNAYVNEGKIRTPYSGRGLSGKQDSFNYYHSSVRICAEQAFGMLVCRFGIFWSALRYLISKCTLIIMVAAKLHNFIIDNADYSLYEMIPIHELNTVRGSPIVHFQDMLHTERDNRRSRNWRRDNSELRDALSDRLRELGFVRKRRHRRS